MAVQAQCPSNLLMIDRSENENNNNFGIEQPGRAVLFPTGGGGGAGGNYMNPRKRGRDEVDAAAVSMVQLQNNNCVDLMASQAVAVQNNNQPPLSLAAHYANEMDKIVRAHGEKLRIVLAEAQRRYNGALLAAAREAEMMRLQEKQSELQCTLKMNMELRDILLQQKVESQLWKGQALALENVVTALQMQLQAVLAAIPPLAEDAESAINVDPGCEEDRACHANPQCRICCEKPASYVLFPCNHLCLCSDCGPGTHVCPVCLCITTGTIEVLLC